MTGDASEGEPPPVLGAFEAELAGRLSSATGLLLCSDFDGTLAPIETDPDAPSIRPGSREALDRLADRRGVEVAIVSGREVHDLRERVDLDGITYAGNHGLELLVEGERVVHPTARRHADEIGTLADRLVAALAPVEGATVEHKGLTATVHYRRAADAAVPRVKRIVEEAVDGREGLSRSEGKEIVEFGPDVDWDKGRAVATLAATTPDGWLEAYVGDDTTDEDAFEALDDGVTVHVGPGEDTVAGYRVDEPAAVEELLAWLADEGVALLGERRERSTDADAIVADPFDDA